MAKKHNPNKLKAVEDTCKICGQSLGQIIVDPKAGFKRQFAYSSGEMHEECRNVFTRLVDKLFAGGQLITCTNCGKLGVTDALLIQVPDGQIATVTGCENCEGAKKDHHSDPGSVRA